VRSWRWRQQPSCSREPSEQEREPWNTRIDDRRIASSHSQRGRHLRSTTPPRDERMERLSGYEATLTRMQMPDATVGGRQTKIRSGWRKHACGGGGWLAAWQPASSFLLSI
jgi:hypothetical protein